MLDLFTRKPKAKNWRFSYVGGRDATSTATPAKVSEYLVLARVAVGETVKIIGYTDAASSLPLRKLGLNPGVSIQLLDRTGSGSVIISLNDRSIGLGADPAAQLIVNCLFEGSCSIDHEKRGAAR